MKQIGPRVNNDFNRLAARRQKPDVAVKRDAGAGAPGAAAFAAQRGSGRESGPASDYKQEDEHQHEIQHQRGIHLQPAAPNRARPVFRPGRLSPAPPEVFSTIYGWRPFNDLDGVESLLKKYRGRIAAVILEPMLGAMGMVVPRRGYLKGLRKLTESYGVLLIFAEIITLRIRPGGIQQSDGVTPDLTALGKIIGGGFPIGAFGGRKDIMALFDPSRPDNIFHSGTFNGTDVIMAAGLAALELYDQDAVDRVNALGAKLRNGICEAFKNAGMTGQATGRGSLAQIHWRRGAIASAMDSAEASFRAGDLPRYLHLELINRGYYCAPRGMLVISTPMEENDIDRFLAALAGALEVLKPYAEEKAPHLLVSEDDGS